MNNEKKEFEYFDCDFFDLDLQDQINYFRENPGVEISPDDVETDYYWELIQQFDEVGEKDLSMKMLELYYNATIEAQKYSFYRRISPSVDAIYAYCMHKLGGKITPYEEIPIDIRRTLIEFCILNTYVDSETVDEVINKYPQLAVFYEILPRIAYADFEAIFPQLLRQIGMAYQKGTERLEKNPEKALEFFLKGADLNYDGRQTLWPFAKVGDCAFKAAVCYMKGIGTEKNFSLALEYFERGANDYGEDAVPAMGDIYLDPEFNWEDYFETEEDRFIAAFEAYNTRTHYFDGSYMKPETWYTAENWDCYLEDFDGDKKSKMKEHLLYKLTNAAESGSLSAAKCLATAYECGIIAYPDDDLALSYHKLVLKLAESMKKTLYQESVAHSARYLFKYTTPEERESFIVPENLQIGDEFEYGSLFGKPIVWQAFRKDEETVSVITRDIIACLPFDNRSAIYRESYVRKWLNEIFYNKVFTEDEKKALDINVFYETSGSSDEKIEVKDYVIILAPPEIDDFFGDKNPWKISHTDLALLTGGSEKCWTRWRDQVRPIHVGNNGKPEKHVGYDISMSLGIRPVITLKTK